MAEVKELIEYLVTNKKKPGDWINSLEERKKEELEFHNLDREKNDEAALKKQEEISIHANKRFYSITETSKEYVNQWIAKKAKGKVFLDYACGEGFSSIDAAKAGADLVIGIDISDVSVDNAQNYAKSKGVSDICYFIQADCENTQLPDESVDVIICQGMLHHLDLSYAFPELRRILKPGGEILCVEALSANPFIQAYRNLTPEMRTDWEKKHILGMKEITFAKRFFNVKDIKFWHLVSLAAVPFRKTFLFKPLCVIFNQIDRLLLKVPYLNRMAWQFTFVLQKPLMRE